MSESNSTQALPWDDEQPPSFDIHVEQCVMMDQDTDDQIVMWKAEGSSGTVVRSNSPTDAVMGVIEGETGGVI